MPSLTLWAERDFDIDALEKYCASTKRAMEVLVGLWTSNATALSHMGAIIEESSNQKNDEEVLNNFLEDRVADRVVQALFQYGKGSSVEPQHVKTLRRCLADNDQKLPTAFANLRQVSSRMSQVSSQLGEARKAKTDADQALLSAIMSKSELEKRFTPSAMGTSQLPASAVNIMKKCDERIKAAQQAQVQAGEHLTELRDQLEDITAESSQSRKESLQVIENLQKRILASIAGTSDEILNLELLLSESLTKETEGIIETDMYPTGMASTNVNQSVQSVRSSVGSSAQSIQGLDWVDHILRTDPSERTIFALSQIAEEVANHESDDELKISDLEQEIEKIKTQIAELQQGKGEFAERLAADYVKGGPDTVGPVTLSPTEERLLRVGPHFSLPLPLKTDCYAKTFFQGFATEEQHADELAPLIDLPYLVPPALSPTSAALLTGRDASQLLSAPPSASNITLTETEWNTIAYEQVLLGYFEISSRYPHLLSGSHWTKLRGTIQLMRVKLKIPTRLHESITELLLPDSTSINDEIPPLDIRFRLCRIIALVGSEAAGRSAEFPAFLKRQLAAIELTIRSLAKEELGSSTIASTSEPVLAALLSTDLTAREPLDADLLIELLESLGTYAEESLESQQLPIPRGFLHQILSRLWPLAVAVDEESGLAPDVGLVAAFLHNFLTGRQYPYHQLWLGCAVWSAFGSQTMFPASVAKQVCEIFKPGEKWLDKVCGDLFWFGRGAAGQSSIVSVAGLASPASKRSIDSQQGGGYEISSRLLGFDSAYILTMTVSARDAIVRALCDYRSSLEPDSLEVTVEVFRHLMLRTNSAVPQFAWPPESDFSTFLRQMCEFFISESARAVCNRLVDPRKFLDSVAVARAHASDEARGMYVAEVTVAIWRVIFEFVCETELYSLAWKKTDLTQKHRLIWSRGLQSRIRSVVDLVARDDDLWLPDRVPPGGQDLLAVLQVWERISLDPGLTEIVRPKISRCLSLHLDRVERDSLSACMHNNHGELGQCWEATRPPTILHSTKCVDLWTTVFTSLQACIDAASAQLSMPTCSQMIVRCVERYCDNAREGFASDLGLAHPLVVKMKRTFNRLVRSVDDDTELPEIFKNKKKRKNRLFKKDNAAGGQATNQSMSGAEDSDDGGVGGVRRTSATSVSAEGLNLIGDNHLLLSDYLVVTCRMGSHDATALMVRLHDTAFSLGELEKVRTTLKESIDKEHVKLSRLFAAQAKSDSNVAGDASLTPLPKLPTESLRAMLESIDSGVVEGTELLNATAELVSAYLGVNLVMIDLREDLLERMYMPTVRDYPLSRIVKRFENEKLTAFVLMTPPKWRAPVARSVVLNFILAWVYVVVDMASRGRVFKDADSNVMNSDLTSLHQLADELGLKQDSETQDLLRAVGCLPVLVSGSSAVDFKASCERALAEPSERTKAKSRLVKAVNMTTAANALGRGSGVGLAASASRK